MTVSVKGNTPGPIELSFIADHVVNCLSSEEIVLTKERSDVFTKAAKFFDFATQGGEILRTGRLSVNASDELRNYGLTTRAYTSLVNKQKRPRTGDMVSSLKEIRDILANLAKGERIDRDKVEEVKELFAFLRDIALAIDAQPTDRITITSFRPLTE